MNRYEPANTSANLPSVGVVLNIESPDYTVSVMRMDLECILFEVLQETE
jgi:hypothetical protein